MSVQRFLIVFSSICLLFLTACTPRTPKIPNKDGLRKLAGNERLLLLHDLRNYNSQGQAMLAQVKFDFHNRLLDASTPHKLAIVAPHHIRLEVDSGLDKDAESVLTVRRNLIHAVSYDDKRTYRGTADRKNMKSLLALPLLPAEAVMMLTARYAPTANVRVLSKDVYLLPDGERALFEIRQNNGSRISIMARLNKKLAHIQPKEDARARLTVDNGAILKLNPEKASDIYVESIHIHRDGKKFLVAKYSFDTSDSSNYSTSFPTKVTFWLPQEGISGKARYSGVSLNPALTTYDTEKLFRGVSPIEFKKIEIDTDGRNSIGRIL